MKNMQQEQADKVTIHNILNTDIVDIKSILGKGEVNRIYAVKQKTVTVVFRLNNKEELARFRKEAWCIEEARKIDIPSPKVIDIGEKNNTAYMILDYVPGVNGRDTTGDKSKIWFDLGSIAKKIHSIETEGFGEVMIGYGKFDDKFERYVNYNIASLNDEDKLQAMNVLTLGDSTKLKNMFRELLKKNSELA